MDQETKPENTAGKAANVREGLLPNPKGKLKEQFHEVARFKHLSLRTEQEYWGWAVRYLKFHRDKAGVWRHPRDLGTTGVTPFLTDLAVQGVSSSTQNLALNALLFLHREVLHVPFVSGDFQRVSRPPRLPVVLSKDEVRELVGQLDGTYKLMAQLLYGTGLRLLEMLRLRVKDIDFARGQVVVREGKGGGSRVTMLPETLRGALHEHLARVRKLHERDLAAGFGWVPLPGLVGKKHVNAGKEWPWQWVFPSAHLSRDPVSGRTAQRANGRLAMITQQFHRLADQFAFVFPACGRVTPPPLRQDFRFGLLAHKVVHLLGNTDFWRNDSFFPPPPAASGNKTFGADRQASACVVRWTIELFADRISR